MSDIELRDFRKSDAAWLTDLHARLYARDEGFDDSFGPLVAGILKDFVADHDPSREYGWIAVDGTTRLGSIFCVSHGPETAKLRLFLLTDQARGRGLGKRLLTTCMDFARGAGYSKMQLWTHESHKAACGLYAAYGWQLVTSKPVHSFGVNLVEQSWRVDL